MHIHKTDLCSPTCGDPTYAETAAGVRKGGGREGRREEASEGGWGGGTPSFDFTTVRLKNSKRARKLTSCPATSNPLRHILLFLHID